MFYPGAAGGAGGKDKDHLGMFNMPQSAVYSIGEGSTRMEDIHGSFDESLMNQS